MTESSKRGRNYLTSLMIGLIESKCIGLRGTELAAEVIAADARFNTWIVEELKMGKGPRGSDADAISLLEFGEEIIERCEAAATAFHANGDNDALVASLSKILSELDQAPRKQPFWPSPLV